MAARAEGFMGTVMAIEGIADATVLLHGPDGCRMTILDASRRYYPRPDESIDRTVPFYKGSPRVPCTGVSPADYIYGATDKIAEALKVVGQHTDGIIAVINSPGASLIGDDCRRAAEMSGLADRTIVLDAKLMSMPLDRGIDIATAETLRNLIPGPAERRKGTVNVLGLNILTKDWQNVEKEFRMLFGMMGLEIGCFLSAGCTFDEMRNSASAEFNVVVCPEYVRETAAYYADELGVDSVGLGYAPVGFDATEELLRAVAERAGVDPSPAIAYIDTHRMRAFGLMDEMRLRLRGRTFEVEAEPSIVLPLLKILYEDLTLVPSKVAFNGISDPGLEKLILEFLDSVGLGETFLAEEGGHPYYVMSNGNRAWMMENTGRCERGVDLGYPSEICHTFRDSSVLGVNGMMYLLDRIVMPEGY